MKRQSKLDNQNCRKKNITEVGQTVDKNMPFFLKFIVYGTCQL